LVAVPVAIAVVVVSLFVYGGFGRTPTTTPSPTPAATAPVEMAAPSLAADVLPVCQQIVSHLPDSVTGRARRPVSAGAEQNAASGAPLLPLACGPAQPTFEPTADVYPLSGVCWYAQTGPSSTTWTTIDRAVPVTVTVPGAAEGAAQSVAPFSP